MAEAWGGYGGGRLELIAQRPLFFFFSFWEGVELCMCVFLCVDSWGSEAHRQMNKQCEGEPCP